MRRRRGRGSRVGGVESAGRGASAARAAGGGGRRPGAEPRPGASGRAGHAERRRTAGPLGGGARACRLGPSGRARADRRRRLPLAPRKPPARARDRRRRTALAGPARGGVAGARAGARDRERRGLSQAVRGRFSAPAAARAPARAPDGARTSGGGAARRAPGARARAGGPARTALRARTGGVAAAADAPVVYRDRVRAVRGRQHGEDPRQERLPQARREQPPRRRRPSACTAPDLRAGATAVREAIRAHLDTHQVSRVIYGAIIGLALVVALEHHPPPVGAVIATLLGTAIAVGLAELYSDVIGIEVRLHRRISHADLAPLLEDVAAVAIGIAFPVVFFLLAAIGAMELDNAFRIAKWTGLGLIAFYGFCAARLSGVSPHRSVLRALAVGLIGAFLIGLKALVH